MLSTQNISVKTGKIEAAALAPDANAPQRRIRTFAFLALALTACFSPLLFQLARLAWKTEIQSHILLIPFISLYLWKTRKSLLAADQRAASLQPAENAPRCGETPSSRDSLPSTGEKPRRSRCEEAPFETRNPKLEPPFQPLSFSASQMAPCSPLNPPSAHEPERPLAPSLSPGGGEIPPNRDARFEPLNRGGAPPAAPFSPQRGEGLGMRGGSVPNPHQVHGEGVRRTGEGEIQWFDARMVSGNPPPAPRSPLLALFAALFGLAAFAAYWIWGRSGRIPLNDALSLSTLSFLALLLSLALATLGGRALRPYTFAIAFLVFMIPLPLALIEFLSIGLQRASAEAADWMISLTGMPAFREGLRFQFPGLSIVVAEECSGVRSTFVLFLTSLLAGHLFLRTGWKKALLALAIFPLGILRNGFRVTAISWLTVNVDRGIINGPLHHHGGPLFFVLSLIPLFALMWLLRRSDSVPRPPAGKDMLNAPS